MLNANLVVPTLSGNVDIPIKSGETIVFIGANGSGKTRLGAYIDRTMSSAIEVHRVSAHRSITLNSNITSPSLEVALKRLKYGYESGDFNYKDGHRWSSKPETVLLNDFDHVIAALYAEENNISVKFRQDFLKDPSITATKTKMDLLKEVWHSLLPHREMVVSDSSIRIRTKNRVPSDYDPSEMSDGERVIFYLIGQALLVASDTALIIDEPELHINKSILYKLFDSIEGIRRDCAFVYITHDVDFAASRRSATKFVIRAFEKTGDRLKWDIAVVPIDSGLPEDVVARILGSRLPILFVEGDGGSLDSSIYRRVYKDFTVIPVGGCEVVIHSVVTFAARGDLHRIGCAGLIDSDGRSEAEIVRLKGLNIHVLPVTEIENIMLLEPVFAALANILAFDKVSTGQKFQSLKQTVFTKARADADRISLGYTRRKIDAQLKTVGLKAKNIHDLHHEYNKEMMIINPIKIFENDRRWFTEATDAENYTDVLKYYDNKGLLHEEAKELGISQKSLEELVGRVLAANEGAGLLAALASVLPTVAADR